MFNMYLPCHINWKFILNFELPRKFRETGYPTFTVELILLEKHASGGRIGLSSCQVCFMAEALRKLTVVRNYTGLFL